MPSPSQPRVHFFICVNERAGDSDLPSCARRGSRSVLAAFQNELAARGYPRGVKVSGSSCLTTCQCGPAVAVYPDGVWYGEVRAEDVPALVDAHLNGSAPLERLLLPPDVTVW